MIPSSSRQQRATILPQSMPVDTPAMLYKVRAFLRMKSLHDETVRHREEAQARARDLALLHEIGRDWSLIAEAEEFNRTVTERLAGLIGGAFEDWIFGVGYYACVFFWSFAFVLADLVPAEASAPSPVIIGPWRNGFAAIPQADHAPVY